MEGGWSSRGPFVGQVPPLRQLPTLAANLSRIGTSPKKGRCRSSASVSRLSGLSGCPSRYKVAPTSEWSVIFPYREGSPSLRLNPTPRGKLGCAACLENGLKHSAD